ncbi:MAG: CRTAC1 family protein [Alphaproteobacteria bacterium]|nr:CRTAC1 family protein [Alphaproteobacteria bacterium]MCB9695557.1 CRTAC1 family protein [Alphaproteobacteria bacterium]
MRRWLAVAAVAGSAACGGPMEPEPLATLSEGAERTCGDPSARLAGPAFDRHVVEMQLPSVPWNWGGGVIVEDLDGDDVPEMVMATQAGFAVVRRSLDGTLTVDRDTLGAFDLAYGTGGSAADVDGDGDVDLYLTRTLGNSGPPGSQPDDPIPEDASDGRNHLLLNRGDGTFEDVTDAAGVDGCGTNPLTGVTSCWRTMTSAWGDVDGDGDLDLYVGNYGYVAQTDGIHQEDLDPGEPDMLYLSNGDGTFEDATDRLPLEIQDGFAYAGTLLDLDDDGDLDLYVVNDFGNLWPNRVLWNDGTGHFTLDDPGSPSGLVQSMTGMGLGIGDLDGDGRPDLAIPQWAKSTLFLSGSGRWVDWAGSVGFEPANGRQQRVGWGTVLGDIDNDGDLDAFTAYGHLWTLNRVWANPDLQPDALYVNEPDGDGWRFVDQAQALGTADPHAGRGGMLADLDGDGWLDLVSRHLDGPDDVLMARCGDARWLGVRARMPGTANSRAIGAKIELYGHGTHQTRWLVGGGTGFASAGPAEAHFGLGQDDGVSLRVTWPDGVVSWHEDVATNRIVTITRER